MTISLYQLLDNIQMKTRKLPYVVICICCTIVLLCYIQNNKHWDLMPDRMEVKSWEEKVDKEIKGMNIKNSRGNVKILIWTYFFFDIIQNC